MNLPPQIDLQVKGTPHISLEDIIVEMTVISGTKNPFHILFPKTADDGSCSISAHDFVGQFTDHYAMGLMDYNGSIASAAQVVAIRLFDPAQLSASIEQVKAWPLLPHESTKWKSREEVIRYLLSCRNLLFAAQPSTVEIAQGATITFNVARRGA
jgi:hypothetical protein